ncbi:DUF559 domain-containing protein [soil metagenome]
MGADERALGLRAARQHGVLTTADARRAGLSTSAIHRRCLAGQWVPVARGVYRVNGVPPTWEGRLTAAVLVAGEGAVVSHRAAGVLWELDGCRPGPPEITIPRGRTHRPADVGLHESTDLVLAGAVRRRGLPVTGAARTLLDLSSVTPLQHAEQAMNDAIRRRLTTWPELLETLILHARRGRNGVGTFRAILDERYGERVPDSYFNQLVRRLLEDAGLPSPVSELELHDGGRFVARIDLAYPGLMFAIELDGRHHATDEGFERDRPRQNRIELLGWLVLRYTWKALTTNPGLICREVAEALRLRS